MDLRQAINFLNTVKSHPYTYRPNGCNILSPRDQVFTFDSQYTVGKRAKRNGAMTYPIGREVIETALRIKGGA